MDSNSLAVFERISAAAATGRYVVFSEDELCASLPENCEKDDKLKDALKELKDGGYIDLKYSSGNLYCIAPLKSYSPPTEPEPAPPLTAQIEAKESENKPKLKYITAAFFISAFFGGALGSLIVSLAFAF